MNIQDRNNNPNNRIIAGDSAHLGMFPYQVSIIADQSNFCGSSIISKNWILVCCGTVD